MAELQVSHISLQKAKIYLWRALATQNYQNIQVILDSGFHPDIALNPVRFSSPQIGLTGLHVAASNGDS